MPVWQGDPLAHLGVNLSELTVGVVLTCGGRAAWSSRISALISSMTDSYSQRPLRVRVHGYEAAGAALGGSFLRDEVSRPRIDMKAAKIARTANQPGAEVQSGVE